MITSVVQRWREHRAAYRPARECIATRSYEVALISRDGPAKAFVLAHHYPRSYPAARVRVGLYRGGELVGVCVFSQPANDRAFRPLPGAPQSQVQLGRFVLLDDVPANGETWFLARAFELLRRSGFEGVVSFADPMPRTSCKGEVLTPGHVGTIYQAFNAIYLGQTRKSALLLLPDGRELHNRALAKVRGRDRGWRYVVDLLIAHGAPPPGHSGDLRAWLSLASALATRRTHHPGNHKYVWALDRRIQKYLPSSRPYPKFLPHIPSKGDIQ